MTWKMERIDEWRAGAGITSAAGERDGDGAPEWAVSAGRGGESRRSTSPGCGWLPAGDAARVPRSAAGVDVRGGAAPRDARVRA
ncbi:hypothetical protein BE08_44665 [Sorangium cellulosum]|uniref:Uncharacterized protein n=1 Tax=Sorangium cellulosum TaxID=56 RepID=A0A150PEG6_SORCE|nr:hypothetical protein BE08_44665 [Sorangium cellulosum]